MTTTGNRAGSSNRSASRVRAHGDLTFTTHPLEFQTSWLVGSSPAGPALLIPATGADDVGPPLVLKNMRVLSHASCLLEKGGVTQPETFTVLQCTSDDDQLKARFLSLIELLPQFDMRDVLSVINTLVELFRAAEHPPRAGELGLWGELLLIATSKDPESLLAAWHGDPNEPLDFVQGEEALEVKTTRSAVRRHRFTLAQLRSDRSPDVEVVSIIATPVADGATVRSLIDLVVTQVPGRADLQLKLHRQAAKWLGSAWSEAERNRYDIAGALSSARLYRSSDIPSVDAHIPGEVSNVEFDVDLSRVSTVSSTMRLATVLRLGGIAGDVRLRSMTNAVALHLRTGEHEAR